MLCVCEPELKRRPAASKKILLQLKNLRGRSFFTKIQPFPVHFSNAVSFEWCRIFILKKHCLARGAAPERCIAAYLSDRQQALLIQEYFPGRPDSAAIENFCRVIFMGKKIRRHC